MDRRPLLLVFLLLATSGCTHVQLRKNTVRQALTVADIQQQQVLDNLAKFVNDPNALPSFSYANQSSSNVTDSGSAQVTPAFARSPSGGFFWFSALGTMFSGSRQALEGFTLNPVNDPRKLELMRCAYQKAVANCRDPNSVSEACPDCQAIQKKFYTGDPDGDITSKANGIVTSECLASKSCWFHYGCKKCQAKHCNCDCTPIGQYCGTYVWVGPEGRDELTKLTLAILDYSLNSAPVPLTKQVSYYIDEYGLPTTQSTSVGQVSAAVQITELPASLMSMASADEVRIEQIIKARLVQVNLQLAELDQVLRAKAQAAGQVQKRQTRCRPEAQQDRATASRVRGATDPDSARFTVLLAEQQSLYTKLRYLNEQLRVEGLKHPYLPAGPAPQVPSSILPFQLQQQALGFPASSFVSPAIGGGT